MAGRNGINGIFRLFFVLIWAWFGGFLVNVCGACLLFVFAVTLESKLDQGKSKEHDGVLNAVFAPKRYRDQMNGVKVIVV